MTITISPSRLLTRKLNVRGIPTDTPEESILSSLKPISAKYIKHHIPNKPMPLFVVTLQKTPNFEDIFQLTIVAKAEVVVEEFKNNPVKQCYRCQTYGHSSYTCKLPPKCVRFGESHVINDCPNAGQTLKCALCKGPHAANYRGCIKKNPSVGLTRYSIQHRTLKKPREFPPHTGPGCFSLGECPHPQHPSASPVFKRAIIYYY